MERIPVAALIAAALVLAGLAIWSLLDENWSGVIVSLVLEALLVSQIVRRGPAA